MSCLIFEKESTFSSGASSSSSRSTPTLAKLRWSTVSRSRSSLSLSTDRKVTDFSSVAMTIYKMVQGTKAIEKKGIRPLTMSCEHLPELFSRDHHGTNYVSLEESRCYHTGIKNNTLYRNGDVYSTHETNHIFVIGTSDLLFFVREPEYVLKPPQSKFHHSSFLSGGPVISAGEIKTNKIGKVVEITDRSGHYKPNINSFLQGLIILRNEHCMDLTEVSVKVHYSQRKRSGIRSGGNLFFNNGHEFVITKGKVIPDRISTYEPFFTSTGKKKL